MNLKVKQRTMEVFEIKYHNPNPIENNYFMCDNPIMYNNHPVHVTAPFMYNNPIENNYF